MKTRAKCNGSTILTCISGIGLIATAIMAVRATPKAMQLLQEAEEEKGDELTNWETIQTAGPTYIPAILLGISTMACIFGANVLNRRNQASLMSAYALLDNSYKDYKRKLKELYGDEAHQNIVDNLAIEKAENIVIDAPGFFQNYRLEVDDENEAVMLFYDEFGKRYFESTMARVISAEYHLNRNYVIGGVILLNEFYAFLGLDPTDYGSEVGWCITDDEIYWIDFNHRKVIMDDGLECCIIEMAIEPSIDWKEYY